MTEIHQIPILSDNYIYVLKSPESNEVALIDPGESSTVNNFLERSSLRLREIFLTHHHQDHIGGVQELVLNHSCKIQGPESLGSKHFKNYNTLHEGESISTVFGDCLVIATPGHTLDHLIYYFKKQNILFCGDALFSFGCGRVFEGTFEMAFKSLQKIKNLPDETLIYCTHEYTLKNIEFSLYALKHQKKSHREISLYEKIYKETKERIKKTGSSLPTNIQFEKKWNLFLKAQSLEEFSFLREMRNHF